METFKLLIAGATDFNDYDRLKKEAKKIIKVFCEVSLASSHERSPVIIANLHSRCGILAERFAAEMGYEADEYEDDYSIIEMAKDADACLYFNDGKSKEIKELIEYANRYKLNLNELMLFIIEDY